MSQSHDTREIGARPEMPGQSSSEGSIATQKAYSPQDGGKAHRAKDEIIWNPVEIAAISDDESSAGDSERDVGWL